MCDFCGIIGRTHDFSSSSKRFCSTACSKKYSLSFSIKSRQLAKKLQKVEFFLKIFDIILFIYLFIISHF